ncbi:M14 family zinc carboxypeptidase [Flavobacteriaceae bacterium]|nr:M14 family zinc carboxypeptidase [Flavobacteriaceae bacterium]
MDFIKLVTLSLVFTTYSYGQQLSSFTEELFNEYSKYEVEGFSEMKVEPDFLQKQIDLITGKAPGLFEIQLLGHSVEDRPIRMVSAGNGDVDVLMWSQMHGNESTATRSIVDLLSFIAENSKQKSVNSLLQDLRIHFIPMLNPDGASRWTRENAIGIDLNRDALRLIAPESQLLKRVRDSLSADYGFNLHDQSKYYNVERLNNEASISFLATAFDYEKSRSAGRDEAMQLISYLYKINQHYIPNHTGRYNDDFEPRAFGDNIQKWGTKLILIETGGFKNDPEKQLGRKLNFVLIGSALEAIQKGLHKAISVEQYSQIPRNDRNLFDLKIENVQKMVNSSYYTVDLGYFLEESNNDSYKGKEIYQVTLEDQGDLSTYTGYKNFNAEGLKILFPKVFNGRVKNSAHEKSLLQDGFLYFTKAPSRKYFPTTMFQYNDGVEQESSLENTYLLVNKLNQPKYLFYKGQIIDLK